MKKKEKSLNPFLSEKDLIKAGYSPGKLFYEILNNIRDLQLKGIITSKEEALAFFSNEYDLPDDLQ